MSHRARLKSISASWPLNLIKTIGDAYYHPSVEKLARRFISRQWREFPLFAVPFLARHSFVSGRDFSVQPRFRYMLEKLVNSSSVDQGAKGRERKREIKEKRRFVVLARAAVARSIRAASTCTGLLLMQPLSFSSSSRFPLVNFCRATINFVKSGADVTNPFDRF